MINRVTPLILVNQAISSVQQNYARLSVFQTEASTGFRVNQVSDDPAAAVRIMLGQGQDDRMDSYLQNVSDAENTLNLSVSSLTEASQLLTQAKSLASQGLNAGNDPTSQSALADQVDSILSRIVDLANTKSGDQYLYGGTASQTQPFVTGSANAQGQSLVTYQGSDQRASSPVGVTLSVDTLYTGSEVFQSTARGPAAITGTTGAAAGTGTDSATGQGSLVVTHTSTTYAAGSGVQPGTNSAAGDTALGPSGTHNLTIVDTSGDGSAGTVSIDGGPAVAFTNADTNLRVASASGVAVFVNTTAITAGFNGTVALTGNGTLSVDGGATTTPITFSGNQIVTDGTTGAVTNVDTTKVTQTGTDTVSHPGTDDVFQALQALSTALRSSASGSASTGQSTQISNALTELTRIQTNVLDVVGVQSSNLQNLASIDQHTTTVQLQTKELVGNLQNADVTSVALGIQQQQNLLQLSLESAAQLFNTSLLNFLH